MIELSSDTDEKFSRHLIIRLPGHAFENNASVGSFINRMMARPEVRSNFQLSIFIERRRKHF